MQNLTKAASLYILKTLKIQTDQALQVSKNTKIHTNRLKLIKTQIKIICFQIFLTSLWSVAAYIVSGKVLLYRPMSAAVDRMDCCWRVIRYDWHRMGSSGYEQGTRRGIYWILMQYMTGSQGNSLNAGQVWSDGESPKTVQQWRFAITGQSDCVGWAQKTF